MMKRAPEGKAAKISTTIVIWVAAAGMLAICIPLVSITKSGVILPVSVVIGVTISTVAIWWSESWQIRDN
jgi:hypothetical protein